MRSTRILLPLVIAGLFATAAYAQDAQPNKAPKWDKHASKAFDHKHGRRAEVLNRDANELNKNRAADKSGAITGKQDHQLNKEDDRIRRQEQRDARHDDGHISKAEQGQLNKEENAVNAQRTQDEMRDAGK